MQKAHQTSNQTKEYFDNKQVLNQKILELTKLISQSKHFICFTGAGISTSSGIADFRSGVKTVLKTGPGLWEKQKTGYLEKDKGKKKANIGLLHAVPSDSHMALVTLEQKGILKFLISQNIDGLHRRSGFNPTKLAELHGNVNLEYCKKCGQRYLRDFRTRNNLIVHDHDTGRYCDNPNCRGILLDTIVNFNESLPEQDLKASFENAAIADLCLVLGSSLVVQPAAYIPDIVARNGYNVVIVNLQKTPLDEKAKLKINGFCDVVLKGIMEQLELKIPKFILQRKFCIKKVIKKGSEGVYFCGLSEEGMPFTFFKQICVEQNKKITKIIAEPFMFPESSFQGKIAVKLQFYGHFKEPNLRIDVNMSELKTKEQKYFLSYDPYKQVWTITQNN